MANRHRGLVGLTSVTAVVLAIVGGAAGVSAAKPWVDTTSTGRGSFAGEVPIGGGRKLYLRCAGIGRPTVILESGIHDSSDPWTLTDTTPPVSGSLSVFRGVSRFTHVCTYDRPGTIRYTNPPTLTTRSTPVSMPRTLPSMVSDLNKLLKSAHIPGPYLLVGHSYGGMIVRLFAQTHPSLTAGLVLVDAFGTDIRRLFGPRVWPQYVQLLNHPGIPLDRQAVFETADVDGAINAIQTAAPLPRVPLGVISKTEPFGTAPTAPKDVTSRLEQVWPQVQKTLVRLEPQTPHILATGSDHYIQLHDPDLTTSVIWLILERARSRSVPRARGHHSAVAASLGVLNTLREGTE
jgi:pimeloyl-ACP methyl ester carboxylesterase